MPLATEADLLDAAATIRESGVSPHGLVLDDHCVDWVINQYHGQSGTVISPPANGHDGSAVEPDFDTPANVEAFAALQVAVQRGDVVYIEGNPSGFGDLLQIVSDDGATMSVHTSAAIGDLLPLLAAGNFGDAHMAVLPLPGPGPGSLAGGNGLWLVDHDDPALNGAAWDVIAWLAAAPQLAQLDAATGYVPSGAAVAAEPVLQQAWTEHPEIRVAYDQLTAARAGPSAGGCCWTGRAHRLRRLRRLWADHEGQSRSGGRARRPPGPGDVVAHPVQGARVSQLRMHSQL